jgi:hypothetical protein
MKPRPMLAMKSKTGSFAKAKRRDLTPPIRRYCKHRIANLPSAAFEASCVYTHKCLFKDTMVFSEPQIKFPEGTLVSARER